MVVPYTEGCFAVKTRYYESGCRVMLTTSCRRAIWCWIVALQVFVCGLGYCGTNSPRLICQEPIYDFGRRGNDSNVTHRFEFRNEGDRELQVSRVRVTCQGCATASVSKTLLSPKEVAYVTVVGVTDKYVGPFMRSAYIESNDPVTPAYRVAVTGVLYRAKPEPDIFTIPHMLYVNINPLYPIPSSLAICVMSHTNKPFVVKSAELPVTNLQYKLLDMGVREGWQVVVSNFYRNSEADGKQVVIHLEGAEVEEIRVPIKIAK